MAFGIETNTELTEARPLTGKQEVIACDCWFSSTGNTIPHMIKYQDAEGMIHSIGNIQIHTKEKKRFCGISVMEYQCSSVLEGQCYEFRLLFHLEECKWKIVWNTNEWYTRGNEAQ